MYAYLYSFAKHREDLGQRLYLAWAGWVVCIWTATMLFLLAIFNASATISRFTRVAGELFGMLITVLFFQEAIKGIVSEFRKPKGEGQDEVINQFQWLYTNGLLGCVRGFIADYGVPLMVLVWTAMSYAVPAEVPSGVPRRLFSPLSWEPKSFPTGLWQRYN
ncbi:hypothetical protein Cni_G06521 [Canna indica]|uniref:Bicarbonate transporter-like transmembrane domain-containing protein n=1 Tax=Canna indica TaxID=4628 RepID=A0AAQ3JYN6_9LILI|nr:hypothetical protein Cni_G06521 [Canna indica]